MTLIPYKGSLLLTGLTVHLCTRSQSLQIVAVARALTMIICANPGLWGVFIEVPAARVVAPIDFSGFTGQAGPGHAALIPVYTQVPAEAGHAGAPDIYFLIYTLSQEKVWSLSVSSSAARLPMKSECALTAHCL